MPREAKPPTFTDPRPNLPNPPLGLDKPPPPRHIQPNPPYLHRRRRPQQTLAESTFPKTFAGTCEEMDVGVLHAGCDYQLPPLNPPSMPIPHPPGILVQPPPRRRRKPLHPKPPQRVRIRVFYLGGYASRSRAHGASAEVRWIVVCSHCGDYIQHCASGGYV